VIPINKVFKALSDGTRRDILKLLSDKDMNAGEIYDCFNMSKPSISKHLDILRDAELIISERNGQFIIYSINTSVLQSTLSGFLGLINSKEDKKNE
jgi:ArsR family transcriptional regulator